MEKIQIKIKKQDNLIIPRNAYEYDAGLDIVATTDPEIIGEKDSLGNWKRIDYIEYGTNLCLQPPADCHVLIHPRSSISKYNLLLCNSIGLCDAGYKNEYKVRFKYILQPEDLISSFMGIMFRLNSSKIYQKNDKIGQLVFRRTIGAEFKLVDELEDSERGMGGFGSSN